MQLFNEALWVGYLDDVAPNLARLDRVKPRLSYCSIFPMLVFVVSPLARASFLPSSFRPFLSSPLSLAPSLSLTRHSFQGSNLLLLAQALPDNETKGTEYDIVVQRLGGKGSYCRSL